MGEDVSERRFALDAADEDAVASRKGQKRLDCLAKALSACSRTDTKQDDPQEEARQHLCRNDFARDVRVWLHSGSGKLSGKVVAADDVRRRGLEMRHGLILAYNAVAPRLKKRRQDCQGQHLVMRINRIIKLDRQIWLLGERTVPLALVVGETAQLPARQFDLDEGKGRVDPAGGLNQLGDSSGCLSVFVEQRKTRTRFGDDLRY